MTLNSAFRYIIRLPNLFSVANSQDKIIEALEAEVIRLKLELSSSEDRYLDMKKKFDEFVSVFDERIERQQKAFAATAEEREERIEKLNGRKEKLSTFIESGLDMEHEINDLRQACG